MTLSFGLCLAGLLEGDKLKMTPDHRDLAGMAAMTVFFHGGSMVWIWFFLREIPMSWSEAFGLKPFRRGRTVLLGAAAGLLFLPAAWGMQWVSGHIIEMATRHPAAQQEAVMVLQQPGLPWGELAFMGALTVLIAPVAEEVLFRGVLYTAIKQNGFPRAACWVTSLLFAAMHFNAMSFVPLAVFSLVLICIYEKTGSLLASITAHSLFNLSNFVIALLAAGHGNPVPVR